MDFVSPVVDLGLRLWDCSAKRVTYVADLEKSLAKLNDALRELKSLREDVKARVEFSERRNSQRTNQVKGWFESVETIEREVNQILQKGDEEIRRKCIGFGSYKLGKAVTKKLASVEKLVEKGKFEAVAEKLPRSRVDEIPMEKTVGLESTFDEVLKCITRENVGIIGLYGMAGVGKSTLLKKINNEFFGRSSEFDVVIWINVSKEASTERTQEAIRSRLQIPDDVWKGSNVEGRSIEIFKTLRGKKFMLLLDDLWRRFNLLKVGVPLSDFETGSKVIFTTRSEEVCAHMEADKLIRVECLEHEKALDLFLMKVGQSALNLHPNIPCLAKLVAQECKGLPLALITIGRSMATRRTLKEWERAVEQLRIHPSKFPGVVDYVYHLFEFSYDSLPNDTIRSCFLSFSLFPKGCNIRVSGIVDLWIGEGVLDEFDDIHDARRQGEEIIGSLRLACLLESGDSEGFVKIHDVVRDVALWIACEKGEKTNKFMVRESLRPNNFTKWKDSERITLWGHGVRDLTGTLFGPNAVTLRVTDTSVDAIPLEFYEFVPSLLSLDLSGNESLTSLPEGIDSLKSLQYLNLSRTGICALPLGFGNLEKLRCLLLDDTHHLRDIPKKVISSLSSLRVLSRVLNPNLMQFCPEYDEPGLLDELESLEHVNDICMTLSDPVSVQKVLDSSKLQRCIRNLKILWPSTLFNMSPSSLSTMSYLEALEIWNGNPLRISPEPIRARGFYELEQMRNLSIMVFSRCEMPDLTWLTHVPCLTTLRIIDCASIREVLSCNIGEEIVHRNQKALSSLTTLHLQGLPQLESIAARHEASAFPLLKDIEVLDCPRLMRLPFDSNTAKASLKEIRGRRGWWDNLVWDDEKVKTVVDAKFVSLDGIVAGCEDTPPPLSLPSCVLAL